MGASSFSEMEKDAIGEIMNISLGASATAVSQMLGTPTNITTPTVRIQRREDFSFKQLEPAIGIEIGYVEGLDGKNVMIFKVDDVRVIVGILMGAEIPEDQFELDEVSTSAIREVMNQMMGSSATALSEFMGMTVNISTPQSFTIEDEGQFKQSYFPPDEDMVVVSFVLEIADKMKSEFMNIMSTELARRLLEPFAESMGLTVEDLSSAGAEPAADEPAPAATEPEPAPVATEPEPAAAEPVTAASEPAAPAEPVPAQQPDMTAAAMAGAQTAAAPAAMPVPDPAMQPQAGYVPQPQPGYAPQPYYAASDPAMLQLLGQMQQTQLQFMELMKEMKADKQASSKDSEHSGIIRPLAVQSLGGNAGGGEEDYTNQEMLMRVPLEVSVEIGRTKRLVKDILEFTRGSLVVLDRMAGEQVDLFVNGQCIAKGDIVVVEDNFGIRITEIVSKNIVEELL